MKNKKGQDWPDSSDSWVFDPPNANPMKIQNKAFTTEFFGATITASGTQVQTDVDSNSALHWIKGDEDADGYFTLTLSTKSHLHLTYTETTPHNILTMEGQKWANPYGTYEWNIEDLGEEGFIHADFDGEWVCFKDKKSFKTQQILKTIKYWILSQIWYYPPNH